jgi:phage terminase large subunit
MSTIELPEWAKLLWEPSRYKALYGGRGAAKSRSVATALILQGAQQVHRVLCAREVQRTLKDSVKRLLDDEIARCGLSDFYESTDSEIRGKNGTLFVFAGLQQNVASVKSLEGITKCWVEEASTISQSSIETLIPTIRQPGSELIFTWNPRFETDPVDVMFRGKHGPPPRTILREVNFDENKWFPDVLREEMEYDKRRDPDKYAHIWLGQYEQNSEARVFKNWRVEEFEVDPTWVLRQGADWGFSVDPSVLVQCAIVGRTLYVPYEAYRVGCEIVDTPELFMQVPNSEKWPIIADSARPETISHMRQNGFPKIMKAVKGAKSLEEGVEFLKGFDIVVHPRCKHLADELSLYKFKTDPLTGLVLPILDDKDNHVIDALRYACEGARRAMKTKPVEVEQPVPMRNYYGRR